MTSQRIIAIDYLKGVCIVLMVMFHLAYFTSQYPTLHRMVYVFHMPIFLFLSGYLTHTERPWKQTFRKILWLLIPYLIMELGYIIMAACLPINEHIDHLTFPLVLRHLFLHPIGPYWYIHTLIICYIVVCGLRFLSAYLSDFTYFLLVGLIFYGLAEGLHILSFANAMYFMAGVVCQHKQWQWQQIFPASWWAIVPVVFLYLMPLDQQPWLEVSKTSLRGVLIVYFMICFLSAIPTYISPKRMPISLFIGRNTLPILLFSPIFTAACKVLIPFLAFDPTRLLYMFLATIITLLGSLGIAWVMDKLRLSPYFCGHALLQ